MMMRLPRNFMFPLAVFAFIGLTVQYVGLVFTTSTRWIFLALLVLYLLAKGRFMFGLQSRFGAVLLLYCGWCIFTSTWSDVPDLSMAKATAFALVAVTFVSAGYWWACDKGSLNAMSYLAPVAVIALLAGIAGGGMPSPTVRQLELYQGMTDNPNMLGSLIVMSLPFLLWTAYKYRTRPPAKWIWIAVLVVAVGLLARTYSRSSILSAGMIGVGFLLSLKLRKTSFILVILTGVALITAATSAAIVDIAYRDYILKGSDEASGILFSRQVVWQKSYENAEEGGWFGIGYGVTVGDTAFKGDLTAVGYGREKGNAQLAIVEETGVVGLAFYLILLLMLFTCLISAHLREKNSDMKVSLGIVTGALAGLIIMSVFEAWWVAPGSPESVYFWSLAGVALGLAQSQVHASNPLKQSRIARGPALYAGTFRPQRRLKG
jgi:O-antigen ligase